MRFIIETVKPPKKLQQCTNKHEVKTVISFLEDLELACSIPQCCYAGLANSSLLKAVLSSHGQSLPSSNSKLRIELNLLS